MKVDGDVNDGARCISERDERGRVNEKMKGPWAKVNGRKMIEINRINDRDERNRVNEKMNGPWIKVSGRKIKEMDVMKGEHDRKKRMQGGVRPVIRICRDGMVKNVIGLGVSREMESTFRKKGSESSTRDSFAGSRPPHLPMEGRMN
ncbi:hypothetical protein FHG87_019074 [Trinorchestia longiramus]|nr:hypothetical protein FHG87_019074 [Trinorchestia longiramus]